MWFIDEQAQVSSDNLHTHLKLLARLFVNGELELLTHHVPIRNNNSLNPIQIVVIKASAGRNKTNN